MAGCREALPPYCVIVAFFWVVESGRTSLDLRGHSDAHELFNVPVPRDGGVAELLEEARHADRRFVAVVCESVDRLARVTHFGTKIEYELEQSGVALLAADEGITADALPSATGVMARKRATPILTRRVKQAIAEWYVLDIAGEGLGWADGAHRAGLQHRQASVRLPGRRREAPGTGQGGAGKVKRRLVRDPVRGPVVTQIYTDEILGKYTSILGGRVLRARTPPATVIDLVGKIGCAAPSEKIKMSRRRFPARRCSRASTSVGPTMKNSSRSPPLGPGSSRVIPDA